MKEHLKILGRVLFAIILLNFDSFVSGNVVINIIAYLISLIGMIIIFQAFYKAYYKK